MIDLSQFKDFTFYNSKEEIVKPTSKWLLSGSWVSVLALKSPTEAIEEHSATLSKHIADSEITLKDMNPVLGCAISICGTKILGGVFVEVEEDYKLKHLLGIHNKLIVRRVYGDGYSRLMKTSALYIYNQKNL